MCTPNFSTWETEDLEFELEELLRDNKRTGDFDTAIAWIERILKERAEQGTYIGKAS